MPVIFEACGQETNLVLSVKRVFKSATSQVGFLGSDDAHHFTVKPRRSAMRTQGALLASWFSLDMMSSSPGWNWSAVERLCNS